MNDIDFDRRLRLARARVKYKFHRGLNPDEMIKCQKHEDQAFISIRRPGEKEMFDICEVCFEEDFPEIGAADEAEPADLEYKCSVPDCEATVTYHDTCVFCNNHVCPNHCDASYTCFVCLSKGTN